MPITVKEVPEKMRSLKIDDRGYPVPWFVDYVDGKPDFRFMDANKFLSAIQWKLCWVCGNKMRRPYVFVAGPMCGINRTSAEPPCHLECAHYSVRNCPFLKTPGAVRREDDFSNAAEKNVAGFGIRRNPGVTLLWITRDYETFDDGKGMKLLSMGEPECCEWWREGRQATRAEIQESIDTGLPILEAVARQQIGASEQLERAVKRFQRYLPQE